MFLKLHQYFSTRRDASSVLFSKPVCCGTVSAINFDFCHDASPEFWPESLFPPKSSIQNGSATLKAHATPQRLEGGDYWLANLVFRCLPVVVEVTLVRFECQLSH